MAEKANELMDKLAALCKRRGFIFQSSEIYGGIGGFWDYGPLGVELKRNIKDAWWQDTVRKRDDVVGLDCSIIMNPKVWQASGHVGGFKDPMVDCTECKARFRADQLHMWTFTAIEKIPEQALESAAEVLDRLETEPKSVHLVVEANTLIQDLQPAVRRALNSKKAKPVSRGNVVFVADGNRAYMLEGPYNIEWTHLGSDAAIRCPKCGGPLTEPREFNLMFESHAGAVRDEAGKVYLRPETAQGIFVNYKNVLDTSRMKLPFGIAQIGKAFRNEINPRNYTFRSREFEQMEIEFFCRPGEADKWYEYWRDARYQWYVQHGLTSSKLHLRDHDAGELAHYAVSCADVEYEFPFGVSELEGIANRTDFDLKRHQECSGRDMTYYDDETTERFIPYVIEPSGGVDRAALAFLCEAYCQDEAPDENGKMQARTVMKLHPRLAPVKVAVFPLVKREGMPAVAREIHEAVRSAPLACFYDEKGAVGRRYRRQDEAGTPFCVTVDGQTLKDRTVTIRDRDSLKQERISKDEVVPYVRDRIG